MLFRSAGASFSNVVAIGDEAGKSLTTASDVVAVGRRAFNSINTQAGGIALGFEAGRYAYGINNTYLGFKSGLGSNTATNNTATNNVGVGFESLKAVTTGGTNVAIGTLAGSGITTGADNVAIGANTSVGSPTGSRNTFIGSGAGNLHDGNDAIGIGVFALNNDDGGSTSSNLAIGNYVGENLQNSTGGNVMIGHKVMRAAQGGYDNTVIGYEAGLVMTDGHSNSILGHEAGKAMTTANELIAVGTRAINSINTQSSGVAVGHEAGRYAYGVNNTYVGYKSGFGSTTATNNTATSNAGLGYESLKDKRFDVVINATAASLQGELPPLPDTLLNDNASCYDMMYAAKPTPFMNWATEHKAVKVLDGLGMLVEQAAEAFTLWRGGLPETKPVIDSIRASLA